jgi:hypothetical protein
MSGAAGVAQQPDDGGNRQSPEQQAADGHHGHAPAAHAGSPVHHRGLLGSCADADGRLPPGRRVWSAGVGLRRFVVRSAPGTVLCTRASSPCAVTPLRGTGGRQVRVGRRSLPRRGKQDEAEASPALAGRPPCRLRQPESPVISRHARPATSTGYWSWQKVPFGRRRPATCDLRPATCDLRPATCDLTSSLDCIA